MPRLMAFSIHAMTDRLCHPLAFDVSVGRLLARAPIHLKLLVLRHELGLQLESLMSCPARAASQSAVASLEPASSASRVQLFRVCSPSVCRERPLAERVHQRAGPPDPLSREKKSSSSGGAFVFVVRVCGGCVRCAPARPCSRLLAAARSFFPPSLLHGLQAGYVKRAVWWRARELTGLGTDRAEVAPETPLVALCTEAKYAEKGDFAKSLAECFKGMTVEDLCGYTEDKLMAFVERQGGPDGLVPAWLEKHGLRRYLRVQEVQPTAALVPVPCPSDANPSQIEPLCSRASPLSKRVYSNVVTVLHDHTHPARVGSAVMLTVRLCQRRDANGGPLDVLMGLFRPGFGAKGTRCFTAPH